MTPEEYQDFEAQAINIAMRGLELPGGVRVQMEPRIQVQVPDEWANNPDRIAAYQKFVDDLQIVMNAMQLQIHMIAGSAAAAPDPPEYRENFPVKWFQEYRKWFDEVVKPTRKSIEDIEEAQNAARKAELDRVAQQLAAKTDHQETPERFPPKDESHKA
jgi:hypothetical protein